MEIILKFNGTDILLRQEELVIRDGYSEPYREEQVVIQNEQVGSVTNNQVSTGYFFIDHYTVEPAQSMQLIRETEVDVMQLCFALQGDCQCHIAEKDKPQLVSSGQHTICYLPRSESRFDFFKADSALDYCVILIPLEAYFNLLPSGSDLNSYLVDQMVQGKATFLSAKNPTITPAMNWLIQDMRTSQRTGSLKRLFIESRLTELLMLQLEQLHGAPATDLQNPKADVRKLLEARELLDTHFVTPPTIVELAKLVGLNEFSLKRGFKAQFRTTILGYITQRRMEEAKRFLLEGQKNISEISYWVGYKNPAHFTVAFKRYFGVLPSTIRTYSDQ